MKKAAKRAGGRPATAGGAAAKLHQVRFPPADYERYAELASAARRTFSDWIRVTLAEAVEAGIAPGQKGGN